MSKDAAASSKNAHHNYMYAQSNIMTRLLAARSGVPKEEFEKLEQFMKTQRETFKSLCGDKPTAEQMIEFAMKESETMKEQFKKWGCKPPANTKEIDFAVLQQLRTTTEFLKKQPNNDSGPPVHVDLMEVVSNVLEEALLEVHFSGGDDEEDTSSESSDDN